MDVRLQAAGSNPARSTFGMRRPVHRLEETMLTEDEEIELRQLYGRLCDIRLAAGRCYQVMRKSKRFEEKDLDRLDSIQGKSNAVIEKVLKLIHEKPLDTESTGEGMR